MTRCTRWAYLTILLAGGPISLHAQQDSAAFAGAERTYALAGRTALWTDDHGMTPTGSQALQALLRAGQQGLRADDYGAPHLDSIASRVQTTGADSAARAGLDHAVTRAMLEFLDDVHLGRTRPPGMSQSIPGIPWDAAALLARVADGATVSSLVRAAEPPFRQYRLLAQALARYRDSAAARPDSAELASEVTRLELAMERLRWIPGRAAGPMIVVNVPAFRLLALDSLPSPAPAITMRVIVGEADRTPTPIVAEFLTAIEFHPYWNVPRSIVTGEILPILRRSPSYLKAEEMEVVTARGQVLGDSAPDSVLSGLADGSLLLRQRPGPRNALGAVKFIFPNAESIYLHDTPVRTLFEEARRDFSHGCIRLEDAPSLTAWVLDREPGWDAARIAAAFRDPATQRVELTRPIPVVVLYTTAMVHGDGRVTFFPDLYGLDRDLGRAMRAPRTQ